MAAIDRRSRAFPGSALDLDRLAGAAKRRGAKVRRGCMEGPVRIGIPGRIRADHLRLRLGATIAGGAVHAAGLDAARDVSVDAAGISPARRRIPAGANQGGDEAPDAGCRQVLGVRALARQRHLGGCGAVRRIPGVGRARSDIVQAPAAAKAAHGRRRAHSTTRLAIVLGSRAVWAVHRLGARCACSACRRLGSRLPARRRGAP